VGSGLALVMMGAGEAAPFGDVMGAVGVATGWAHALSTHVDKAMYRIHKFIERS